MALGSAKCCSRRRQDGAGTPGRPAKGRAQRAQLGEVSADGQTIVPSSRRSWAGLSACVLKIESVTGQKHL